VFGDRAEQAMAMFASTSPSYLILQSLDAANRYLADGYRERLAVFAEQVHTVGKRLRRQGYMLCGDEPLKLTIAAKAYGYTGTELADLLAKQGIEWEFADPDYLVMMVTPEIETVGLDRLCDALLAIPSREPICVFPPSVPRLVRRMTPREALFAPAEPCAMAQCVGRVLATPSVSCPPAVPIAVWLSFRR
jgi:arginine/lysine/ornithine decarboxylase